MKPTVIEPARFALSLAPVSKTIYAGKAKILTDGKRTWGQSVGVRHDVTPDFYHIMFQLANMLDDSETDGGFVVNVSDGSTYDVTIKKIKPEAKS